MAPNNSEKRFRWWSDRTKFEKLLVLILTLIILMLIFLGVKLYLKSSSAKEGKIKICLTPTCIHSAAKILQKLDSAVDPCDDFYKFACGKFLKNADIPDETTIITSYSDAEDEVLMKRRKIYEEPLSANDSRPLQLLKKSYRSCMNTTRIESESLEYFQKLFKSFGGWPVIDAAYWNDKFFDWRKLMYHMRRIGIKWNLFLSIYIDEDLKNSSRRLIMITQPNLPYERFKKGFNDSTVRAYYEYLVEVAMIFGAEKVRALSEMREVVLFTIDLAKISVPWEKRKNTTLEYNPMTIRQLQREFPSIPWLQYLNVYLDSIEVVGSEDVVVVQLPKFLANLENLLLKTSRRVLGNYMIWMVIKDSILFMPESIQKKHLKYLEAKSGQVAFTPRWKECIWNNDLRVAASYVYIKRHFDPQSRKKIYDLVWDIRSAFHDKLKYSEWMDPTTKKHAILKADRMNSYIGYPDELLNEKNIEDYYQTLELDEDEFPLELQLNISKLNHHKKVRKLRGQVLKPDWEEKAYSYVVNAFYDRNDNNIELPAGILQDIYYNNRRPQYMNYGALGEIIGHEITHGFDDIGRQFDKDGNLIDWWAPETNRTFNEKAQCLVDQYGNYTVDEIGMRLNGISNLGENIADNGGIKIAYEGYERWAARNPEEPALPGLNYTPRQMFWISGATTWCAKYKKEDLKSQVMSGFHAPNYYRVLVPYMNSGYFAVDFACPLGTKMNPIRKCRVW